MKSSDKVFMLSPEVAGGLGSRTIITNRAEIEKGTEELLRVSRLHYLFEGWLGDDLLESTPCFVITERLCKAIQENQLSGFAISDVDISTSDAFRLANPTVALPKFFWLQPKGWASIDDATGVVSFSGDDICVTKKAQLIVKERCLWVLQQFNLRHCKISELVQK